VRRLLEEKRVRVTGIDEIMPSLEDVFIALVGAKGNA
jgi:hypothetical protein